MIHSASFFWRADQADGFGFTLNVDSGWPPKSLTDTFTGPTVAEYFRESDLHLGTGIVAEYQAQLSVIAKRGKAGMNIAEVVIAALNIMYLTDRGFLANDEFNGPMFVLVK